MTIVQQCWQGLGEAEGTLLLQKEVAQCKCVHTSTYICALRTNSCYWIVNRCCTDYQLPHCITGTNNCCSVSLIPYCMYTSSESHTRSQSDHICSLPFLFTTQNSSFTHHHLYPLSSHPQLLQPSPPPHPSLSQPPSSLTPHSLSPPHPSPLTLPYLAEHFLHCCPSSQPRWADVALTAGRG